MEWTLACALQTFLPFSPWTSDPFKHAFPLSPVCFQSASLQLLSCHPSLFAYYAARPGLRIIDLNLPLLLLEFWTPLRKQDNCQNMCHYTCIVYKLNLIDIFMCLIICHSYSHNAGVTIGLFFLSPLTQAPSPSTRTLLFLSYTHTQSRNH